MNILHFVYDHTANPWLGGGGAVRAREMYKRLAPRHDVTIICGKYPGAHDYREGPLKFHFEGTDKDNYVLSTFCYAARAGTYLRRHHKKANVVVEDFSPYNPLFSYRARKDTVLQLHQKEGVHILKKYLLLGIPSYMVERFYPSAFRHVITVSEKGKKRFGLEDRARVISNGIDGELLTMNPGKEKHVLFLGRLEIHSKGLDILLDAAALAKRGACLVIAGKGKDRAKVVRLAGDGIEKGDIHMAGFVEGEEKKALLRDCLFMVVPSRFEAQGIVVLEAAALGKPVIVSDVPELQYAVEAGFGISFRTGEARDLADKMNILMANEQMREKMGRRAREYAKDFVWDRLAEEYERFLFSVASLNGRA